MTDRRERIREYKERARPMGVFRVRNLATGDSLIGSSVDLPSMLNRQRFQLEMGSHPNRALQDDWARLGESSFELEVLDTLDPSRDPDCDPADDLLELEELWAQRVQAQDGPGYGRLKRTRR